QADWLSRHLETHILANHYFENLKALLFVNVFFGEQVGKLSLAKLEQRFLAQLEEQFLPDGGHYERSPSYHCLLLSGLLDLIELDQHYAGSLSSLLSTRIREKAIAALQCLWYMELPGDGYPLFNDSAFDSAPRPSLLYKRAASLSLAWTPDALERQIV